MASRLRERMLRIFPQLEEARITHSWAGFVGMTSDGLPHVAEHDVCSMQSAATATASP